jgi:hypothetical protein
MNCTIVSDDGKRSKSGWYYRPMNADFNDLFQYPSDATKLTNQARKVLQITDDYLDSLADFNQVRIGLVQRRAIHDAYEIEREVKVMYPKAVVESGEMENLTFEEHPRFWNRQDVVVAAHVAAMTNALWMRCKNSIVEIFPLHYCVLMYRELCHSAGIYHFSWMDSVEVPEYDYDHHRKDRLKRWHRGTSQPSRFSHQRTTTNSAVLVRNLLQMSSKSTIDGEICSCTRETTSKFGWTGCINQQKFSMVLQSHG